jgi:hypothetical protein
MFDLITFIDFFSMLLDLIDLFNDEGVFTLIGESLMLFSVLIGFVLVHDDLIFIFLFDSRYKRYLYTYI